MKAFTLTMAIFFSICAADYVRELGWKKFPVVREITRDVCVVALVLTTAGAIWAWHVWSSL